MRYMYCLQLGYSSNVKKRGYSYKDKSKVHSHKVSSLDEYKVTSESLIHSTKSTPMCSK